MDGTVELRLPPELDALEPGARATRLAALAELGPRPSRDQPELVVLDRERLQRHLARGEAVSAAAARVELDLAPDVPDDLADAIGAIPAALRRRWRIASLDVLDVNGSGYWQILRAGDDRCVLATSTTRHVWTQLVATVVGEEDGRACR